MSHSVAFPRLALGTAPLGSMAVEFGFAVSDADARATVERCFAQGIRFIDTAPWYGNGLAEQRIGEALAGEKCRLSTKAGWVASERVRSYKRDAVLRSVDESLRRLRVGYLDVVHIHDPDEGGDFSREVLDEGLPALYELKRQGVIGAVGCGMNQWRMSAYFARHADLDCVLLAGRYSLLEQEPLAEFFPLMLEKKIAVFLGGVFNSGILATGAVPGARFQYAPASEAVLAKTRGIEAVCARHGVPLRAVAAQFAAAHPAVSTLVLGMVTPAQVDDNVAMLGFPVPAALWEELRAQGWIDAAAPTQ